MTSIRNRIVVAGVWSLGVSYVLFVANFICNLLVARFLGPESYGIFVFAASIQLVISVLLSTPISWLFIRTRGSQEEFDSLWVLALLIGVLNLLIGIGGSLLIGYVAGYLSGTIFFLLSFSQLPLAMATVHLAVFEKKLNFRMVEGMRGGAGTIGAVTAVLAAWGGAGVWSLVARELIPAIVLWFLVIRFTNSRFSGEWKPSTLMLFLKESVKYSVARILEQGFFRAPFILIGQLFGTVSLGLFNQAFYVAILPNTLLSPISERIAFPGYALAKGDKEMISRGLFWASFIVIRVAVLCGIATFLCGDRFILFLYGQKWRDAAIMLPALGLFVVINPIFATAKTACFGVGEAKYVNGAYLLAIVVVVASIYVAAKEESMVLLAGGYGVAMFIGLAYMLFRLRTHGIRVPLFAVGMAPTIYCVLVIVLSTAAKQIAIFAPHQALFAGVLLLLYPAVLWGFDRKRLITAAELLK